MISTVLVLLWVVGGALAGSFVGPISAQTTVALCLAAAVCIDVARRGQRRRGFDEGYQLAARHAVDIARLEAIRSNEPTAKKAAHDIADALRSKLELEGARDP